MRCAPNVGVVAFRTDRRFAQACLSMMGIMRPRRSFREHRGGSHGMKRASKCLQMEGMASFPCGVVTLPRGGKLSSGRNLSLRGAESFGRKGVRRFRFQGKGRSDRAVMCVREAAGRGGIASGRRKHAERAGKSGVPQAQDAGPPMTQGRGNGPCRRMRQGARPEERCVS